MKLKERSKHITIRSSRKAWQAIAQVLPELQSDVPPSLASLLKMEGVKGDHAKIAHMILERYRRRARRALLGSDPVWQFPLDLVPRAEFMCSVCAEVYPGKTVPVISADQICAHLCSEKHVVACFYVFGTKEGKENYSGIPEKQELPLAEMPFLRKVRYTWRHFDGQGKWSVNMNAKDRLKPGEKPVKQFRSSEYAALATPATRVKPQKESDEAIDFSKISIECDEDKFCHLVKDQGFTCDLCAGTFVNLDQFFFHVLDSRWHTLCWMRLRQMLGKGSSHVPRFQFFESKDPDKVKFAFDHLNRCIMPCEPRVHSPS